MRLDLLYAHCADLEIEVEWTPRLHVRGDYCHAEKVVRLHTLLTRNQATSTLAHELGHAAFGDECSTPAIERRADEYGASLIVTPSEYRAAEALVGHRVNALAIELGVTNRTIEAWRRWYERARPRELFGRFHLDD